MKNNKLYSEVSVTYWNIKSYNKINLGIALDI